MRSMSEIFKSVSFSLEECKKLIDLSEEIVASYKTDNKYTYYDQKLFYVIFIISFVKIEINDAIEKLEVLLEKFTTGKEISEARKLVQKRFKDYVMQEVGIESDKIG